MLKTGQELKHTKVGKEFHTLIILHAKKFREKSVQRWRRKGVWKKLDVKYNGRSSVTQRATVISAIPFPEHDV